LACVEVEPGKGERARPDPVGHQLVEDLLTQGAELVDPPPGDEGQRRLAGAGHVGAALDGENAESQLAHTEPEEVTGGEVAAGGKSASEVVDGGALHQGVVDIEETGRGRVGRGSQRRLHLGRGVAGRHRRWPAV
jgi:hypothetical protein